MKSIGRGARWSGLLLALVTVLSLPAAGAGAADLGRQMPRIPAVRATSLNGSAVDLPAMLTSKVGVLVLGFGRGSQQPVTDWGKRLAGAYRGSTSVVYYEMPMLADVPRLVRGLVVRSMRRTVPERAQGRFVPLTENEAEWKAAAGFEQPDEAYVLLVDQTGAVRWRGHGPATEKAFDEVAERVRKLESGQAVGGS